MGTKPKNNNEEIVEEVVVTGDGTVAKKRLKEKIKSVIDYIKKHWNKPPAGKYLTLKEIALYCIGGMGVMGGSVLATFMSLQNGIRLAYALNLTPEDLVIVGIAGSIITLLRSPINSWIIDNFQSNRGKFRPWLIILPLPMIALIILMGWILPALGSKTAVIVVFIILFNLLSFLLQIYSFAYNTLVQVISPLQQERTELMSLGLFASSLGPSIVNGLLPIVANFLFTKKDQIVNGQNVDILGMNTFGTYKYIVPAFAVIFLLLGILAGLGTKERTVLPKVVKAKVGFIKGIKKTIGNKYMWISNISTVLGVYKLLIVSKQFWIYTVMQSSWAEGVFVTVLGSACVPGMLLAPMLIKKFGKKAVVIVSHFATLLFAIPLLFITNYYAIIAMFFLMTVMNSVQLITAPSFMAQMYDYQQYKTGERMEGFISLYSTILMTAAGMALIVVEPAILKRFNYVDGDSFHSPQVFFPIFRTMAGITVGSGLLAVIPYFFWDITEERHDAIMEILAVRANYNDGKITEEVATDLEARLESGEVGIARKMFDEMFLDESELTEQRKAELEAFEAEIEQLSSNSELYADVESESNEQKDYDFDKEE